ncbi:MAG: hypothetical protein HC914_15820 [Chloroflexaceae bacterium]|nr:hypothetical protein [Chloroflexaceae bacterium]
MHKATWLEATLWLSITPNGPVLIKASERADPTRPSMEFVRTRRNGVEQVYLPGPSLKGVVRAQAERICRTLDRDGRNPAHDNPPLADNPVGDSADYTGLDDTTYNSGRYMTKIADQIAEKPDRTAMVYRQSALTAKMFGHTSLAGRIRFADAYDTTPATQPNRLEERNGVAIDRVYGSVAVGPFNYETLIDGTFTTRIDMKNITLAQLALLGLALRDLAEGRVAIGFGKSRGLGRVKVTFDSFTLRYPVCTIQHGNLHLLTGDPIATAQQFVGVGALCRESAYHLPSPETDTAALPAGLMYTEPEDDLGVTLTAEGDAQVWNIWRACMPAWRQEVGL